MLIASTVGLGLVGLVEANFSYAPPIIAINSPANGATYYTSDVSVNLTVTCRGTYPYLPKFAICGLDGENPISLTFVSLDLATLGQYSGTVIFDIESGSGTFNHVSQGSHNLTAEVHLMNYEGANIKIIYNVSSTFNVDLPTPTNPPAINLSLGNRTYDKPVVPLVFNVNDSTSWIGFSIDNQANVTIRGNVTLTDLTEGNHTIAIYANDTYGNMGKSDVAYFNVSLPISTPTHTASPSLSPILTETPNPSPTIPEIPPVAIAVIVLTATILVDAIFRTRKKGL